MRLYSCVVRSNKGTASSAPGRSGRARSSWYCTYVQKVWRGIRQSRNLLEEGSRLRTSRGRGSRGAQCLHRGESPHRQHSDGHKSAAKDHHMLGPATPCSMTTCSWCRHQVIDHPGSSAEPALRARSQGASPRPPRSPGDLLLSSLPCTKDASSGCVMGPPCERSSPVPLAPPPPYSSYSVIVLIYQGYYRLLCIKPEARTEGAGFVRGGGEVAVKWCIRGG
jgi:hypothetical protein